MKDLGERIRTMRASRNLTQADLASALNVSRSAVAMWESGDREPSLEMIEGLADTFNVSISSLVDRNPGSMYAPYPNILPIHRKRVRLLGEIAAGVPIYAEEDYESFVWADGDVKCDFALRACGDSMVNARIQDGDIVFIREQSDVEDGEIAAVIIDDSATLKRLYHVKGGVMLASENPKYAPMHYTQRNSDVIKILGKAVAFQSGL